MRRNERGRQIERHSGLQETTESYRKECVGGDGGNQLMGIREGTCGDELWVLYATNNQLLTNGN